MTPIYLILATFLLLLPAQVGADTIHGCVKQKSGKLRIVGDPGQCTDKEAAVSWNSEGPQGPQGECGPAPLGYELVGFTTATFDGDEGFFGFHFACQADFSGSRMCNSEEVIGTVNIPGALPDRAWVNPSAVESERDPSGRLARGCLGGGLSTPDFGRWVSVESGATGLTVDALGKFSLNECAEFHHVACCAAVSQ
jgi:hypothetical protein